MIRISFFFLLLVVSCGRDVKISNSKLESQSSIFLPEEEKSLLSGTLYHSSEPRLLIKSRNYTISRFSSYQSLQYISTLEEGRNYQVTCKGKISGSEIILESIEAN